LTIAFAAAGGLGGGDARAEVAIFDLHGRLVRRVVDASYPQGFHTTVWDGTDGRGHDVASGVYFLRTTSLGQEHTLRLAVVR
jgi:flagellar hook assembly protein FlgD